MSVKRVVIIGATSGIGLEVAKGYLKAGWQVGIAGRREEELEKLRRTAPEQVCAQVLDVTHEDAPYLLKQLIDELGGMDLFLLSSGIGKQNLSLTLDIELQTAATNVEGFIRMVTAAYHYFEQQGHGHLAVISSIAGPKDWVRLPPIPPPNVFRILTSRLSTNWRISTAYPLCLLISVPDL